MKRIFSLILSALLAVAFTTAHAQTQEYVLLWTNGGNLSVKWLDEVDSITFREKPAVANDTLINNHKFVDLGLPSGLLWADCNVGASSPYEDGDYYAWGETETKSVYYSLEYEWGKGDDMYKYNASDGKTILDADDDVATVKWGVGCRMPSIEEINELRNECDWEWKYDYQGTSGYLVTGFNGNTIFFPASGYKTNNVVKSHGTYGNYWSRSLGTYITSAGYLGFTNNSITGQRFAFHRSEGFTIRPVATK